MSTLSNVYAEKIFSEHPIGLWPLDDQADYISLITEENRNIYDIWSISGGTLFSSASSLSDPFPNSYKTLIKSDVPTSLDDETVLISTDLLNFQDFNSDLQTFCIGTYFYYTSLYPATIKFGYEYTDPDTSEIVQNLKTYYNPPNNTWSFLSETFEIPNINVNFRIVIKLTYYPSGGTIEDYAVLFNGISLGQWSEEFNAKSLGLDTIPLPNTIALDSAEVIEAKQYGLDQNSGYYFTSNNSILAKNLGVPMVYGASSSTRLIPNDNNVPSLIIPGNGFLNKKGKHNEYTVEFWLKVNCSSNISKRIFGPISSNDGIYLDSAFLTLSINSKQGSHFISEWDRPMFIQIRVIKNSASLILNGEEVISLSFITDDLVFPDILNELEKEQDWLGFYVSDDTSPMEIDCIALYSYNVPITVAKRRFVYGQGVLSTEKIDSSYNGFSASIDYSFADYTANYTYPDFARWDQATFDNFATTRTSLSNISYSLPEIFVGSQTVSDLYNDNYSIQDEDNKFITFRPNSGWNTTSCYFNFPRFNIINDQIHTVYAVVKIKNEDVSQQTILKIYNSLTGNSFNIDKDGSNIRYYLIFNSVEEEIYTTDDFNVEDIIAVGIDLEGMSESFGGNVAAFFGNQNGMKMYVGGDQSGTKTFAGNIYSVGLSSSTNETKIEDHFYQDDIYGIANINAGETLLSHTASYTLLPNIQYDKFYLNIGSAAYWEDYLPLSYFGQYVKNNSGQNIYDLDFLQFNIGYPSTTKTITIDGIKYLDTQNEILRSYVTFQYIINGANLIESNFTTQVLAKENKVLNLNDYPNWETTKFEITDGTVIYPPTNIDFNSLAIVYHIELNSRDVLDKQINLKKLEICSQALNNNSFNPIGTQFGINLFPYKKSGIYYDYKSINPYSIYKGNTPYLYLTKNSGIELKNMDNELSDRGIAVPINSTKASDYKLSAIQFWLMNNHQEFSQSAQKLMTVNYKNETIIIYIVANSSSGDRARIYAKKQSDGSNFNGLAFYLNGKLVKDPVINIKQWNAIGITFLNALNFNNYLGKITLNAPFIFNNISYYQANAIQEIQSRVLRPWFRVRQSGATILDWQYWNSFTWEGVLVVGSTDAYNIDPSKLYNDYTGTNKTIVDDGNGISFNDEKLKIYKNIKWSSSVDIPV